MDACSDPDISQVVLMTSAQIGKTSVEENVVGFHIAHDPSPILFVMPTLELASAFSKDRLAPMVRDTPGLSDKIGDARSRDSSNTVLHKRFPGGHLTIGASNSPASLASRPIRLLIMDEVDRFPASAGAEGDPVAIATKRTTAFWNRKVILSGTPTIKGFSRIEAAWLESDQRRFLVPCPDCEHEQSLKWAQVRWPEGQPDEAAYCCESCGSLWSDVARWRAIRKGRWEAEKEFNRVAGFHINEIYSPFVLLAETANNFLEAKQHPERLKVWVNTSLGETWEETAEKVDPHALEARAEDWGEGLPPGILLVTAGVDLQADRAEVEVVGWGADEESWSIQHEIIYGDPSTSALWASLDAFLLSKWKVPGCGDLAISAACIDTGGHHTQQAYSFCKDRFRRRVFAIKGKGGEGVPVWPKRASYNNKPKVPLFLVGVDAAKDLIYARLRKPEPGAGYCHFPSGRDPDWFAQLTAEKVVTKYVRGFPTRVYQKDHMQRNEALDCRVYAYAALCSMNVNWGRIQAYYEKRRADKPEQHPGAMRRDSDRRSSRVVSNFMRR